MVARKLIQEAIFILASKETEKATLWTIQRSYEFDTRDENHKVVDNITEPQWRKRITQQFSDIVDSGDAIGIRYIFHDSDVAQGVIKGLHVHAIARMKSRRYVNPMIKMFGVSSPRNIDIVKDLTDATKYLLHISSGAIKDNKHIYGESDLHELGTVKDFHEIISAEKHAGILIKRADLMKYEISAWVAEQGRTKRETRHYIKERVGDDTIGARALWLRYRGLYDDDISEYIEDKSEEMSANGRDMKTLYISGRGGTGKSILSQEIAKLLGDGQAPFKAAGKGKGKTFDFSDGYKIERVGILDDVLGANFELAEFLQNFDPYIYSRSAARNKNAEYLADYTIMNSSVGLDKFAERLMIYSKGGREFIKEYGNQGIENFEALADTAETRDRLFQVMRRFKYYLKIQNNEVTVYKFNAVDAEASEFKFVEVLSHLRMSVRHEKTIEDIAKTIVDYVNSDTTE